MKEMREKSYGGTRRVPDSMKRIQQAQHRPGAKREERLFSRVRHYDYPWRRSKHGNLVLKRSWEGVKGLRNPQYIYTRIPSDEDRDILAENERIIRAELKRRLDERDGKKAA